MAVVEEPKKPLSPYFLFVSDNRETVQKELGLKDFGPVNKTLSERWKKLPDKDKAPYEKRAAERKTQYEKDMAEFIQAGGVKGRKRKEKAMRKDAKKDPNYMTKKAKKEAEIDKPKKPTGGGFGVYLAVHREEIHKRLPQGSRCSEVTKVAAEHWKAMDAKQKAPYDSKYQVNKAKYDEEIRAWEANRPTVVDEDSSDGDP